jgi:transposase
MVARVVAVIRIDTLWLCSQPQDMRAGADRLLNIVVNTVGAARAHHGYLFANARATRIKLLVHDGFGVWCATRRLHAGRFVWLQCGTGDATAAATLQLTAQQFEALTVGLPWQRLGEFGVIKRS